MNAIHNTRVMASKLFLACLLASTGSVSMAATSAVHKDWSWLDGTPTTIASTSSVKYGGITLAITFNANANCEPVLNYAQLVPDGTDVTEGAIDSAYQIRIDKRPIWDVPNGGVLGSVIPSEGDSDWYNYGMLIPSKLLRELVQGYTIRVKEVGSDVTDRFSLHGSARAIRSAYQMCEKQAGQSDDPDLQYFGVRGGASESSQEKPESDRDYFQSSKKSEKRPGDKDNDRSFF